MDQLRSIEICAGAGGQALGLEQAGFQHVALVELEGAACSTLLLNRPNWNVIQGDVKDFHAHEYEGIDLLAGGVPCPPFSVAGKQLGASDDRDLFPEALRLVREAKPKAVMLENVRGIFDPAFDEYRKAIRSDLKSMGYQVGWRLVHSSDYGVPQLRPRAILVALQEDIAPYFAWPEVNEAKPKTVGEALFDLMGANGWRGLTKWQETANKIAPTVVGGSKKHGGPDLGPTRARQAWAALGVEGSSIADAPPEKNFKGMPKLTVRMVARLQGFPDSWEFAGKKTPAYRQVGNAFPPPVAHAIGDAIHRAILRADLFSDNPDHEWLVNEIEQEVNLESIL